MIITVTKENFRNEVINSSLPVLIDFWADWCSPCRSMSPLIDQISEEHNNVRVAKVNVSEQPELAEAFGVASIPAFVLVKNGKIVNQLVGKVPKDDIVTMISS